MLLGNGQKGKLGIEVDELLDDDFFHIATTSLHSLLEGLFQFTVVMNVTLSVAG